MAALVQQLALVSESEKVELPDVMRVSAALQKQASRDLAPIWEVSASVDAFATLDDVPQGYWAMIIRDDIGFDAAGIHLDRNGQPFALITSADEVDEWSLTASHETLEMLVDPFGNRLMAGDSPKPDQARVDFLVEVSDPSEAAEFGYSVNGIAVSDFYTPNFFDPVQAPSVRYSFTGAITEPRDVLRGGYLSWGVPETGIWWQETWFGGSTSRFRELGPLDVSGGALRAQIDRITGPDTAAFAREGRQAVRAAGLPAARMREGTAAWAGRLHEQIDAILAASGGARAGRQARGKRGRRTPPAAAAAPYRREGGDRRSAPRAWE